MSDDERDELDPSSIFVLVPDKYGLAIVAVGDLFFALSDNDTLADAITNSAIDSVMGDVAPAIERVRALNETGDANAYWDNS